MYLHPLDVYLASVNILRAHLEQMNNLIICDKVILISKSVFLKIKSFICFMYNLSLVFYNKNKYFV